MKIWNKWKNRQFLHAPESSVSSLFFVAYINLCSLTIIHFPPTLHLCICIDYRTECMDFMAHYKYVFNFSFPFHFPLLFAALPFPSVGSFLRGFKVSGEIFDIVNMCWEIQPVLCSSGNVYCLLFVFGRGSGKMVSYTSCVGQRTVQRHHHSASDSLLVCMWLEHYTNCFYLLTYLLTSSVDRCVGVRVVSP